jgi:hypothetical protein
MCLFQLPSSTNANLDTTYLSGVNHAITGLRWQITSRMLIGALLERKRTFLDLFLPIPRNVDQLAVTGPPDSRVNEPRTHYLPP